MTKVWLLCLLGVVLFSQGQCRPNYEPAEDYPQDGDEDDYEGDDEDAAEGPPPTIKSVPVTLELGQGEVALLPCEVEGNPKFFSRVWRKDSQGLFVGQVRQVQDERITQLPDGSLELRQVKPSDSGSYSCFISVQAKPQEVAHTIKVKSPAKITKITPSEETVTLKQTSTLTLECIAEGYPVPSIKWFKNGHVLEDQDPSIHGARYTIDKASTEDAGYYKCTATNGQHIPDERTIEVQVHYPPEVHIARGTVPTGEGYESELKCIVTGPKKPELKWYKDGEQKPIISSQRIKLEKNGQDHILRIIKTQQNDFGDYKCEAKNTEGSTYAVIRLTGKPSRPELELQETDKESKDPVVIFKVESFAPIEEYELLYKREEKDEWVTVNPTVAPSAEKSFTVKHTFTGLEPGVYQARLKAKNNYGWSEFSDIITFPKEHEGDLTETGLLAIADSSSAELRISLALLVSMIVAHFYC